MGTSKNDSLAGKTGVSDIMCRGVLQVLCGLNLRVSDISPVVPLCCV